TCGYVCRVELQRALKRGKGLFRMRVASECLSEIEPRRRRARFEFTGLPKVRQGLIELAVLEQGYAEPDPQIRILRPHRKDPPKAFDRLGVIAEALHHHAQQPDCLRFIR